MRKPSSPKSAKSKSGPFKPKFGSKSVGSKPSRSKSSGSKSDSRSSFEGRGRTSSRRDSEEGGALKVRRSKGPWKDSAYRVTAPSLVKPVGTKPEAPKASTAPIRRGEERLQKVLARAGVSSRRNAEVLILEGRVTVNGKTITELGTKVDSTKDKIKVNGKLIFTEVEPIYIAFHKPRGVISAMTDPEGRQHLGHFLHAIKERVIPVGRMDFNSEGLLLLTNDGDMADLIMKARSIPRVYMVKIKGHPTREDLDFLKKGIFTAEGVVRFASFNLEQGLRSKSWLKLEVVEGSNLDLKEMLNHRGLLVDRIVRTAIGPLNLKGIEPGEYKMLRRQDLEKALEAQAEK